MYLGYHITAFLLFPSLNSQEKQLQRLYWEKWAPVVVEGMSNAENHATNETIRMCKINCPPHGRDTLAASIKTASSVHDVFACYTRLMQSTLPGTNEQA